MLGVTEATARNWRALKGKRVKITWRDPHCDWPYFVVDDVDEPSEMIFLKGADYPDGTGKHRGDFFWVGMDEVETFEEYRCERLT